MFVKKVRGVRIMDLKFDINLKFSCDQKNFHFKVGHLDPNVMKQCQYYPQNNRNCSDCRMNMEQERGKSKIAIAAFDKYYLLLVLSWFNLQKAFFFKPEESA